MITTVEKAAQHPMDVTTQEVIETFNVVTNTESRVGAYTLNLIVPPKLTSEFLQLPTLEPKRFLRILRIGQVKQLCVIVV